MSLQEQLEHIKVEYPEAWEYLNEPNEARLPRFDDNDEMITEEEEK